MKVVFFFFNTTRISLLRLLAGIKNPTAVPRYTFDRARLQSTSIKTYVTSYVLQLPRVHNYSPIDPTTLDRNAYSARFFLHPART